MIKKVIKKIAHLIFASIGRHHISYHSHDLLVLTYHRVLPADDRRAASEQPGMMVSPGTFKMHLQILKEKFEIVSLSEWLEKSKEPATLPRRACAITFDDGWKDNYEFAYPILRQEQVPATIFLVSDYLNRSKEFWPNKLNSLLRQIASELPEYWDDHVFNKVREVAPDLVRNKKMPDKDEIDRIINHFKKYTDIDNHTYIDHIYHKFNIEQEVSDRALLNKSEVNEMLKSNVFEIGSHTCDHTRLLGGLSMNVLKHQVADSKKILQDTFGVEVSLFCYPNGDYSEDSMRLVAQNYTGACTTESGWNTPDSNYFLLRRINIHEDMTQTKTRFLSRISGFI